METIFPQSPGWQLLKSSPAPHLCSSPTPGPFLVSAVCRACPSHPVCSKYAPILWAKRAGTVKSSSVRYSLTSSQCVPTLAVPLYSFFTNGLLSGLFSFCLVPQAFLLMLPEAFVVFLKYKSDFTLLLKACKWVPFAFRIKSIYLLTWVIRLFLFCALPTYPPLPTHWPTWAL